MSDIQTWEWPPEMAEALEHLNKIMIRNPEPNRRIKISDLVRNDELQPEPYRR